ncbi:phage terminase-like large subunit protein [Mycobacterium marinum M]|uniref:Phage terminase-like large subunit protein n=1 Tax=Mycobacterium marinum (strain ATCC BAA-535 / M) TaxID=216594 RepID=B2HPG1_MYCMM|nr:terminase [Mycobacterium marinum]ACC42313.1 phage terminase-like large subunit protein [Mycobacterium marinum M]
MDFVVPPIEPEGQEFPTLGGQVCAFLEERACYGPGDLKGKTLELDPDRVAIIYRAYEVWPMGHNRAGRRRWKRIAVSVRKGFAKTELMALIAYAELHPESPVRFDGFNRDGGLKQGRPVFDPYIPMLANAKLQVNELAFGALKYICEEGPDADLFDSSLERIIRLDVRGRADGKAVPLANAPDSNDGGRTTFQGFDETHRLYLPSERAAVTTMEANLGKRVAQDPWSMSTTTAGEPGQNSVAETDHFEAEAMARGEIKRPRMFYFHRQASDDWDMDKFEDRVEAIREASGPELAARTDLEDLASQWDIPNADKPYLERVWTNRWTQQGLQAFNLGLWKTLARPQLSIPRGAYVTVGFDGARFRDATALVMTDVKTGLQQLEFLAEQPLNVEDWEVDEAALTAKWNYLRRNYKVLLCYGDPAWFSATLGAWSAKAGVSLITKRPIVQEFWTNKQDRIVKSLLGYESAINSGVVTYSDVDYSTGETTKHGDLTRHVGNAGKKLLNIVDLQTGKRKWILGKLHKDRKFDGAMAGVLSWDARMEVLPLLPKSKKRVITRIR